MRSECVRNATRLVDLLNLGLPTRYLRLKRDDRHDESSEGLLSDDCISRSCKCERKAGGFARKVEGIHSADPGRRGRETSSEILQYSNWKHPLVRSYLQKYDAVARLLSCRRALDGAEEAGLRSLSLALRGGKTLLCGNERLQGFKFHYLPQHDLPLRRVSPHRRRSHTCLTPIEDGRLR